MNHRRSGGTVVALLAGCLLTVLPTLARDSHGAVSHAPKKHCTTRVVHGKTKKSCKIVHMFGTPSGIAVAADGSVYVADAQRNHILRLSPAGKVLSVIGGPGTGPGRFAHPWGLALDSQGNLYVSEAPGFVRNRQVPDMPRRVQKLAPDGSPLAEVPDATTGEEIPCGIAVDAAGTVYLSDFGGGKIVRFDAALHRAGTFSTTDPWPCGMAVDREGNIDVSQGLTENVARYSPSGTRMGTIGSRDDVDPPFGVATDTAGGLYVINVAHSRVVKYSASGQKLRAWGNYGVKPGQFSFNESQMLGIAADRADNIYVSDPGNRRVQKFSGDGRLLSVWE